MIENNKDYDEKRLQQLLDRFADDTLTEADEEELQTRPGKLGIPWYLEGSLRNLGGVLDTATAPWTSHVVVDRNLITGQNPASAEATADAIIDRLSMQGVVELSSLKESVRAS